MLFVAEVGSNHKGVESLAFEMIRQAALAGADIVKFQLGWPPPKPPNEGWTGMQDAMRYAPMEWVENLAAWCQHFDVEFMASIWSKEGLEAARSVKMRRYKIPHQLLGSDLATTILETGRGVFQSGIRNGGLNPLLRGIYVSDQYPLYPSHATMPDTFDDEGYYGYSSHMHGYADALIAIARGAQYIEKHVTLDKTEESIRDNHFALSFQEFGEMVKIGREMGRLI